MCGGMEKIFKQCVELHMYHRIVNMTRVELSICSPEDFRVTTNPINCTLYRLVLVGHVVVFSKGSMFASCCRKKNV